ncbi:MAG: GNAT family N-acetyltransferase [Burkholderiales bacterium]|nr:GNAT family N-acetyltransferase [Burkholderiales bacterium]
MSDFSIKKATPEDCELLLELIKGLAVYEKLESQCVATAKNLRASLFGADAVAHAVIGYEKNEKAEKAGEEEIPIAFALYFYNFSTFLGVKGLYLEDIFVKEPYRHKGYGQQLMVYLANVAIEENCGRFEWSVLDWNKPAIQFYESLGAKVLQDWRICRVTGESLRDLALGK